VARHDYADDAAAENRSVAWVTWMRQLEIEDVISLLRTRVKRAGGVVAWSAKTGIHRTTISKDSRRSAAADKGDHQDARVEHCLCSRRSPAQMKGAANEAALECPCGQFGNCQYKERCPGDSNKNAKNDGSRRSNTTDSPLSVDQAYTTTLCRFAHSGRQRPPPMQIRGTRNERGRQPRRPKTCEDGQPSTGT
jgi:hypothetical protein